MKVLNGVVVLMIAVYALVVLWGNRDKVGGSPKKTEAVEVAKAEPAETAAPAAKPKPSASASAPTPTPATPQPVAVASRVSNILPHPAQLGRAEAAALYPDLAAPESALNQQFVALYKEAQANDPRLLSRPDWPLTLVEKAVLATGGTIIPRNSAAAQAKTGRQVSIFTTSSCPYCKAAKAYFAKRGIYYREIDIEAPAGKDAFRRLGGTGTPLIMIGNQKVKNGFEERDLDQLLL